MHPDILLDGVPDTTTAIPMSSCCKRSCGCIGSGVVDHPIGHRSGFLGLFLLPGNWLSLQVFIMGICASLLCGPPWHTVSSLYTCGTAPGASARGAGRSGLQRRSLSLTLQGLDTSNSVSDHRMGDSSRGRHY